MSIIVSLVVFCVVPPGYLLGEAIERQQNHWHGLCLLVAETGQSRDQLPALWCGADTCARRPSSLAGKLACVLPSLSLALTMRLQPEDILLPEGLREGASTILKASDPKIPTAVKTLPADSFVAISSAESSNVMVLYSSPLKIEVFRDNHSIMVMNERSLFHYEVKGASKDSSADDTSVPSALELEEDGDRHKGKEVVDYGEDGLAIYADGTKEQRVLREASPTASMTESFGGHVDTMPHGPMSVGMDIAFPFAKHVYGLPEHAAPLSLPTTAMGSAGMPSKYAEPYRLYNLDVFEYELNEPMALYGSIPFLMAHGLIEGKGASAAVVWFNPTEAFVDISDGGDASNPFKQSHWMFESGMVDLFVFPGPSPQAIYQQITSLVGGQMLPPIFSLGYHQCRWNYRDERDVAGVDAGFEEHDFPMDVIWLDIEYTDGKRYFTWDKHAFPNPLEMQKNISSHGRRMVTVIDPHIKTDPNYHIHKEATELGLYIKEPDGKRDYKGWCWPGEASYLDFTNPRVREYWSSQFRLDRFVGTTMDNFIWNDMNEPSVFNGPEVSMRKDMVNLQGIEHREWHNLYGLYMQRASSEGLIERALPLNLPKQRSFVLSRAFWLGSQRYGAIWTGDNAARWDHLQITAPMLLSIALAGYSFAGSDTGGFFGHPDSELFVRWMQLGAFSPFFRNHAHHDSKRREPWVYGDETLAMTRATVMLRYSLLPYWYTTFHRTSTQGIPVIRPLFIEFPDEEATFAMDGEYMVGDALLVRPVTNEGVREIDVYLPGDEPWYDLLTYEMLQPFAAKRTMMVAAPLEKIPVYLRGGKILPRKMRLRRSSKLMFYDPLTIMVALDREQRAEGYLYTDDEISFAYEQQNFAYQHLVFRDNQLSTRSLNDKAAVAYDAPNTIERVIILGLKEAPKRVLVEEQGSQSGLVEATFSYDAANRVLTIKKPDVKATGTWTISLA
jgi:mannosyl-oligosaccharide alpha-1,3-glucosidase